MRLFRRLMLGNLSEVAPTEEQAYNTIVYKSTEKINVDIPGLNMTDHIYDPSTQYGTVIFDNDITEIPEYLFGNNETLIELSLPNSVKTLGDYSVCVLPKLEKINVGNKVINLGIGFLAGCPLITTFEIPNTVNEIPEYALSLNASLSSVTIPNSITAIGDAAFLECPSLSEFKSKLASADGRCLIIDGVLRAFAGSGLSSYKLPSSITSIGSHSLTSPQLSRIIIPESVTTIEDYAFYLEGVEYDSNITEIIIEGSNLKTIGVEAFYECDKLTTINIPDSVTSIGESAFKGCRSLTSVTIPNSVTSIENNTFTFCYSLTSITIPDSVTSIGSSAFYDCTSLTSIIIPDSVTWIGSRAFHNCTSLTSVTIGDGVTSIDNEAFTYCESLTSVTIGDSITSIGKDAFRYSYELEEMYFKAAEPPTLYGTNGSGIHTIVHIYVPIGSGTAYKKAWIPYSSYIEEYDFNQYD